MGIFDSLFGGGDSNLTESVAPNAWAGSQSINNAVHSGHDLLKEALAHAIGYVEPWNDTGKDALNVLAGLFNLPGATTTYDPSQYIKSVPGYLWQGREGQRSLDASAAAKGMLFSGPQRQASQQFGQNLASTYYDKLINSLTGLSNTGLTAGNTMGNWELDTAGKRTGLEMQGAQGTVNALSQINNAIAQDAMINQMSGQSGLSNILGLAGLAGGVLSAPITGGTSLLGMALGGLGLGGGTNALSSLATPSMQSSYTNWLQGANRWGQ